jgi:conjugal transfer mating pair stabilization protein TraN
MKFNRYDHPSLLNKEDPIADELSLFQKVAAWVCLIAACLFPIESFAATCYVVSGPTCIDNTPSKVIGNTTVTLEALGQTCWQYSTTYACKTGAGTTNYCSGIQGMSNCTQTSSTVSSTAWDGSPNTYAQGYQCSNVPYNGVPYAIDGVNVVQNATSYGVVSNTYDYSACNTYSSNSSCVLNSDVCTGSLVAPYPGGNPLCTQMTRTYSCGSAAGAVDYCAPLATAGCTQNSGTSCMTTAPTGGCLNTQKSYNCSCNYQVTGTATGFSGATSCNAPAVAPSNVTLTNTSYVKVADTYDYSTCTSLSTNAGCVLQPPDVCSGVMAAPYPGAAPECTQQKRTFACTSSAGAVDNCAQLVNGGCTQSGSSVCTSVAANSSCLNYNKNYTCSCTYNGNSDCQAPATAPTNVTLANTSYAKIADTYDYTACGTYSSNTQCTLQSDVCSGAMLAPYPGAPAECVAKTDAYSCTGAVTSPGSGCSAYSSDPGCSLASHVCSSPNVAMPGGCDAYQDTYTCQVGTTASTSVTNCQGNIVCVNGVCNSTGYAPDTGFADAATSAEIMRQASMYTDGLHVFSGDSNNCREKPLGSCCMVTSQGSSFTNRNLMGQLAQSQSLSGQVVMAGIGYAGVQSWNWAFDGSSYVFDTLFSSDLVPNAMFNWLFASSAPGVINTATSAATATSAGIAGGAAAGDATVSTMSTAATSSMSAFVSNYTLTYTSSGWGFLGSGTGFTAAAPVVTSGAGSTVIAGTTTAAAGTTPSVMGVSLSYDASGAITGLNICLPCIGVMVALYILTSWLSCTPNNEETILSLKRGANLCVPLGSYCSSDHWYGCTETTQSYCCYNSKLAKIINVQGKAQLGLSLGSPQSPNCVGFTTAQMSSLDLSAMDFSEFTNDLRNTMSTQKVTDVQSQVKDNTNCISNSQSYFGAANANCQGMPQGVIHNTNMITPFRAYH